MCESQSLYAWAQDRQVQLRREAERRRRLRQARSGGVMLRVRLPFAPGSMPRSRT